MPFPFSFGGSSAAGSSAAGQYGGDVFVGGGGLTELFKKSPWLGVLLIVTTGLVLIAIFKKR